MQQPAFPRNGNAAALRMRSKTDIFSHPDFDRRLRIHTGSADPETTQALAGWLQKTCNFTAGGEFHPALKTTLCTAQRVNYTVSGKTVSTARAITKTISAQNTFRFFRCLTKASKPAPFHAAFFICTSLNSK
jgi:hypothetical protein